MSHQVLVAGIGNVFFGDDGFGVEVVARLARRPPQQGVTLMDAGIRGFDLEQALRRGYDAAVLVDATSRGGEPGRLYLLALPRGVAPSAPPAATVDGAHGMDPARVLSSLWASGDRVPDVYVVGCEPAVLGTVEEPAIGLSGEVAKALDAAVELVRNVAAELVEKGRIDHDAGALPGVSHA